MVALTYPFDAVSGSPNYSAAYVRQVFHKMMTGGIVANIGLELQVIARTPNDMFVRVQSGSIWVGNEATGLGLFTLSTSDYTDLAVPSNSGATRYDRVVVRIDLTTNPTNITLVYRQGTGSPPTLTQTSTVFEYSLAQVTVVNGETAIADSDITDERADSSLCGYSRSRVDQIEEVGYPVNTGPSGNNNWIDIIADTDNDTVTVPSGKQWWIQSFFIDPSIAIWSADDQQARLTNSSGVVLFTYVNPATGNNYMVEDLTYPILVNAAEIIWFQQAGMGLTVLEVDQVTSRTPVHVILSTTAGGVPNDTYTVPADNRFVMTVCQIVGGVAPTWAWAETSAKVRRPRHDANRGWYYQMTPQPERPVIFMPGETVQVRCNTATAINYFVLHGYIEPSNDVRNETIGS
jgi:hypothetical protein